MSTTHWPAFRTDTRAILDALGIATPREIVCRAGDALPAALQAIRELPGDRVVLKVAEPFLAHKTEAGAVRIVEKNEAAIVWGIDELALRLDATRVAICEFIEHDLAPGGELLLAIRWTEELGPVVTLGLGGIAAEVLSSVAVMAPRITRDPVASVREKAFAPLISGFRNQRAKVAASELRALLTRCLAFAEREEGLSELEINPLVPTERGLVALDVLCHPRPAIIGGRGRPSLHRATWKIDKLLHPRSVAVMGVSATARNAGRIIANNARPNVTIVKAGETDIDGIACVPDLASLAPVDLLVLAIPAEQVPDAMEEIIATRKAESVIIIPGGLGEYEGSEDLERRIRDAIASSPDAPVVNGANCLGVQSPGVNTIFLPREKFVADTPREVPLAIVSQSGALAASLQTRLAPFAPRYLVSLGNQLDLTAADYLRYLDLDGSCDVAAFYVEGFAPGDGRRFFEIASRMKQTVILYRAGRTPAGRRATSSHTASIAGDVMVARELAAQSGVLFAETLDEFTDLILLTTMLRDRRPRGPRLGVMSNAGFETVAVADNHERLAMLGEATRDAIAKVIRDSRLDRIVTVANPLDVNPMLTDAPFARIAELLLADDGVDAALIGCIPLTGALRTLPEEILSDESIIHRLAALWHATAKPWAVAIDSGALYDAAAQRLHEEGVPVFRAIDRAARALGKWSATLARS